MKRLDKLFFYRSDNFIVKPPPMVMLQTMHCLQQKCTKTDFLLIFDKKNLQFFEGIDLKENTSNLTHSVKKD